MKSSLPFRSVLAQDLKAYVALKRSLGRQFETGAYCLSRLDRFLASCQATDLTSENFLAWAAELRHLKAYGRWSYMRTVYNFCVFRRRRVPTCFLPDPTSFPAPHQRACPYIFTTQEIARILSETTALKAHHSSPLFPQVARIAIVLLYTTGMRRGELVRLTLGDYDSVERTLLIRDTKFHKSRLLPLSDDAVVELEKYLMCRRRTGFPTHRDAPLLINSSPRIQGYTGAGLGMLVRALYRRAEVRRLDGRPPRVHDLRFSFVAHALLRWYNAGINVQAKLPALSAYLGHVSVASTQYYLTFLDSVGQAACDRFDQHCSQFLKGVYQ